MKSKAIFIKCSGEAHTNGYIDNCAICMPYWEIIPKCPIHKTKTLNTSGFCKLCRKYYDTKEE